MSEWKLYLQKHIKSVPVKYRKRRAGHLLNSAVCRPCEAAEWQGAGGDWRNLHSEQRRDLYLLRNFIWAIKQKEQ
jgi:hypothetical protein